MEWKQLVHAPTVKENTWQIKLDDQLVGMVLQPDPLMEIFDAYQWNPDRHRGKGYGPSELGRFASLATAQQAVEEAVKNTLARANTPVILHLSLKLRGINLDGQLTGSIVDPANLSSLTESLESIGFSVINGRR